MPFVFLIGGTPVSKSVIPRPPSSPRPQSQGSRPTSGRYSRSSSRGGSRPNGVFANVPARIELEVEDQGRQEGMPKCPIVLLMGKNS